MLVSEMDNISFEQLSTTISVSAGQVSEGM